MIAYILVALLCAAAGGDVITTLLALRLGCTETNPVARFLLSQGRFPFAAIRILATVGVIKLLADGLLTGPALYGTAAITALASWVVYHNWSIIIDAIRDGRKP